MCCTKHRQKFSLPTEIRLCPIFDILQTAHQNSAVWLARWVQGTKYPILHLSCCWVRNKISRPTPAIILHYPRATANACCRLLPLSNWCWHLETWLSLWVRTASAVNVLNNEAMNYTRRNIPDGSCMVELPIWLSISAKMTRTRPYMTTATRTRTAAVSYSRDMMPCVICHDW